MVDIVKATCLREQGMTYKKIAEELACSVDWCKQNLKSVSKNSAELKLIDECIILAKSEGALTNGQIKYTVRSIYPVDGSKEQKDTEDKAITRFKTAIRKEENTIIRPYWMQPENAKVSFDLVLSSVDEMSQRMTDCVDNIRQTLNLDASYDNSLRYAIIKMLQGSYLVPEGLENHCTTLANIADQLEERNNSDYTITTPYIYSAEKSTLKKPSVKKCILDETDVLDGNLITLEDLDD